MDYGGNSNKSIYLSFNESYGGGPSRIAGCPDEESDEVLAALRDHMPLKSGWALWEQTASGVYSTSKVVTFRTAQEFWAVFNGIPQPSELLDGKRLARSGPNGQATAIGALSVFRDGISPEWEDPANTYGGDFQIMMKPTAGGGQIDEYWNNLVLAMVGESLEMSHLITGVRLVDKLSGKGKVTDAIRLELWYHSRIKANEVTMLKRSMEKCLMTRIDGSQGAQLKGDAIQDKKHNQLGK